MKQTQTKAEAAPAKGQLFSIQNESVLHIGPTNGLEYRPITGSRIFIGDTVCGEWYDTGNEVMAPRIVQTLNAHAALAEALRAIVTTFDQDGWTAPAFMQVQRSVAINEARAALAKAERGQE